MAAEKIKPNKSQEYYFKKAKASDIEGLMPFFKKTIKGHFPEYSVRTKNFFISYEYSEGFLKTALKKQLDLYLAFCQKEKDIVGYLMASRLVGGICLANWLAVSPKHQGKGIATNLLLAWQEEAKKQGMHKLHLWASKRNIQFYKNRGFVLVGEIPANFYGADDYLFYKTIQKPQEKNFLRKH